MPERGDFALCLSAGIFTQSDINVNEFSVFSPKTNKTFFACFKVFAAV